jgi:hypothetical protein
MMDKDYKNMDYYELYDYIEKLRKQLDIAKASLKLILAGKPGVNLSNDYLRGWDIGIADETLRKLEGE